MNWGSILEFLGTDAPTQGLIWTIFALGVFVSYRILDVADLSVESLFPFAGILSLLFVNNGIHPILAILIAVILGGIIGFINGCLHIYFKINPLLAGIIIMVALYSPNVIISSGNISLNTDTYTIFTGLNTVIDNYVVSKLLILGFITLGIMALMYWFFGTELGLSLRAAGKNINMARAQGINTNSRYLLGMVFSAILISLSGALYGQMIKHVSPDAGKGSIVIGLTIIFLGEVLLGHRSFKLSLFSVALGGIIYWLIIDIIIQIPGFNTNYLNLLKGILITFVVVIPEIKKFISKRAKNKGQKPLKEND
ncbi:MAG: ABC transporter permease [Bacilli bacterium]